MNDVLHFDLPKNKSSIIKVIGVGGGGGNAVNYMYSLGIKGIDYAICNTDRQHLENSPIPVKLQLGANITEGLGAGANPNVGKAAAEESREEIEKLLTQDTKMVFITAGMGGGTGTGAAPVIAEVAKSLGILTVGIVTTPFNFEGKVRLQQAESGIAEMKKFTDSLIIINNNKLREIFGNLGWKEGFAKADEVVATASRSIAEVITRNFNINIDLRDVRTVLSDSGTAIMGSGRASGNDRASKAVKAALDSPLLNDNHIYGATNVLLLINGSSDVTIDEIAEINDYIQDQAGGSANIIMGLGEDESLGQDISVTVIATGFNRETSPRLVPQEIQKTVHVLKEDDDAQKNTASKVQKTPSPPQQPQAQTPKVIQPSILDLEGSLYQVSNTNPAKEAETTNKENENTPASASKHIILKENSSEEVRFELEDDDEEIKLTYIKEPENNTQVVEFDFDAPISAVMSDETHTPGSDTSTDIYNRKDESEGVLRFTLEDEDDETSDKSASTRSTQDSQEDEISFELKTVASIPAQPEFKATKSTDTPKTTVEDPFDLPIDKTLTILSQSRIENLKQYNYAFRNKKRSYEEMSAEPAYKRKGLTLTDEQYSQKVNEGRISVSGSGSTTELRANNSFLHDNVD
ncbi:MAG: cell division protein FtsZ [Thermaurantimonas sp.]